MENKEKYLNFFGDSGDYRFHPPRPNPYGLRGNPDEFDWAMDRGGDGLNGTYQSFNGEEEHAQFLGKFGKTVGGWFKRSPDKQIDLSDGNTYAWSEIESQPELMNLYNADKNLKKAKRKEWWTTFGSGFNTAVQGLGTGYASTQQSQILQGPQYVPDNSGGDTKTTNTTTNQAGFGGEGSMKTIGIVLVSVVVLGGIVWAVSAATPQAPRGGGRPQPLPRPNTPNY